jgi:PKD repeat protein
MKLKFTIITLLILRFFSLPALAQPFITVQGHVTDVESGAAVPMHNVFIWTADVIENTITDNSGFYSITFPVYNSDSAFIISVMVSDCNNLPQVQTFTFDFQPVIIADFQICTGNTDCSAFFFYENSPQNPLLIDFVNLSYPADDGINWQWEFGDGSASSLQNPQHEYAAEGVYTVCLVMTDSTTGCTSVFCNEIWAGEIISDCQAQFYYENTSELTVSFTNISLSGNNYVSFWDFGDGNYSAENSPSHTYEYPGTYLVCLSIYDSTTLCTSQYCELVEAGNTLPQCTANYTFEVIGQNTLSFTNLSTGMFDEVIWDFGDGSAFSNELNAVHTYANAGIYNVCLMVRSNYFNCQDVMCLEIIVGDISNDCNADFSYQIDSVPGHINHYQFFDESAGTNISSWYWNFGDGNISFVQNPEHTFAQGGTYNVCLIAGGEGFGGYCSDTICKTITTPQYFNLGGQVFAGKYPINNPEFINDIAKVTLFKKSGNALHEITSGLFHEYGYYFFVDVMEGDYVVHAELIEDSPSFKQYVPAYTGSTHSWQASQHISLTGQHMYEAHIYMQNLPLVASGSGYISGNINSLDNTLHDHGNRIIFLFHQGNVVDYAHTNSTGNFVFSNLHLGSYQLKAEIASQYSRTVDVNLSDFQNQAMGLNIDLSASGIFGTEEVAGSSEVNLLLFPNPASSILNVSLEFKKAGNVTAEIVSTTGIVQQKNEYWLNEGNNTMLLNTLQLPQGLYILVLKSGDGSLIQSQRFVIQR